MQIKLKKNDKYFKTIIQWFICVMLAYHSNSNKFWIGNIIRYAISVNLPQMMQIWTVVVIGTTIWNLHGVGMLFLNLFYLINIFRLLNILIQFV